MNDYLCLEKVIMKVSCLNLNKNQFDGINFHYTSFKMNSQLSENAKKAGLKIGSWTVNELSDLAILQQQGVEWITTNQPQQFQKQIKDSKQ